MVLGIALGLISRGTSIALGPVSSSNRRGTSLDSSGARSGHRRKAWSVGDIGVTLDLFSPLQ